MKKLFALILTLALAVIFIPWLNPAQAAEVTAVTDSNTFTSGAYNWAKDEITTAVEAELIKGYPDGTFQPANTITRAEFATVMARALDVTQGKNNIFNDVPENAWYAGYVKTLVDAKIIKTGDYDNGILKPDDPITRKEIAVWTARAADLYSIKASDVKLDFSDYKGDEYLPLVKKAVGLGILKGYPDGSFRPCGNADRAEAVVMLVRMLRQLPIYTNYDTNDALAKVNGYFVDRSTRKQYLSKGFVEKGVNSAVPVEMADFNGYGPIVTLDLTGQAHAMIVKQDGTWKIARVWSENPVAYKPVNSSVGNGGSSSSSGSTTPYVKIIPEPAEKHEVVRNIENLTGLTLNWDSVMGSWGIGIPKNMINLPATKKRLNIGYDPEDNVIEIAIYLGATEDDRAIIDKIVGTYNYADVREFIFENEGKSIIIRL
ncbi:MAG: Cellulosome-anchoring protein precursor [Pelotomaculum sp. PtaU1.Bin065]|nr:MAG: Cellulosome-anchoring protein precursor [Pelotomaculum sp. PtaU1.Bin065]